MKGTDRYHVDDVRCRVADRDWPVSDLSVGGFYVESAEPLPKGHSARFDLMLPGGQKVPLTGLVSWVNEPSRPAKRHLPAGFGVKITRIEFPDKMRLLALLRDLKPDALRSK
jgi:hypothetical protein